MQCQWRPFYEIRNNCSPAEYVIHNNHYPINNKNSLSIWMHWKLKRIDAWQIWITDKGKYLKFFYWRKDICCKNSDAHMTSEKKNCYQNFGHFVIISVLLVKISWLFNTLITGFTVQGKFCFAKNRENQKEGKKGVLFFFFLFLAKISLDRYIYRR